MEIANMSAYLSAGLAVGLGAIGSGWGIGNATVGAIRGLARQPAAQFDTFRNMLINQAFGSNASIFALLVGILLWKAGDAKLDAPDSLAQAAAFLGAGLAIGIGSFGSGIGSGLVSEEAVEACARCPSAQRRVNMMMFIGQAWSQTPCVFAFMISMLLIYMVGGFEQLDGYADLITGAKYLGMGFAMGGGAIGPAIGIGFVGSKVCRAVSEAPEHEQKIRNAFFIGAAVSESTAVYALVVSLLLMG